ncbi:glycosyltransferase [Microvirga sp. CF3062]|uniref:glycosyltransferase n=1 Tax=Microvirga sp. CF3062 TaxID=3110182 RepID=UPI002E767362|nr:glycosyltransferase [Microvirga sp. CF3062]MEE1656924.1 glycosyltransferase [Microvirga sp. CF3062]
MASAIHHLRPERVFFYYEHEPRGPWWDLTSQLVERVPVKAPTEVFGNPIHHYAHRADVLRLDRLLEHGGIYMDVDVIVHRSFDDLLGHAVVLGQEGLDGHFGLANAVILAQPGAAFLRRWREQYRSFRNDVPGGRYWAEHSVALPKRLAETHVDEVTILPHNAFYWPLWDEGSLRALFTSTCQAEVQGLYANHLWESLAWDIYLAGLTPGRLRASNSIFSQWLQPYVAALPDEYGNF